VPPLHIYLPCSLEDGGRGGSRAYDWGRGAPGGGQYIGGAKQ